MHSLQHSFRHKYRESYSLTHQLFVFDTVPATLPFEIDYGNVDQLDVNTHRLYCFLMNYFQRVLSLCPRASFQMSYLTICDPSRCYCHVACIVIHVIVLITSHNPHHKAEMCNPMWNSFTYMSHKKEVCMYMCVHVYVCVKVCV